MTNEERLQAAGWQIALNAKDAFPAVWTHDGVSGYTEDEALVVVLTAERYAAIARAEAAEALAASRPEITPELADRYVNDPEGFAPDSVLAALRAHAAKVSR